MNKNTIETLTGAFVLIVAAWFLMFFMKNNTGVSITNDQYNLIAKFEQADGISVGTPVRVAGVKVGVVTKDYLDPKTYFAVINISINKNIKIPLDSTAKIASEGLVGGKYLSIAPGADDETIPAGGEIRFTQSSVSLETLIAKMIFSQESKNDKKDDSSTAQPAN